MALKFFNIRSREVRVAETQEMIAAMWASSDRGPNASQGQDFGWRLAPEVVVELRRITRNPKIIQEIAARYSRPFEDIGEKEILKYISDKTKVDDAPVAQEGDYEDEWRAEIARLESGGGKTTTKASKK